MTRRVPARTYRITVEGELPPSLDRAFEGAQLTRAAGRTTMITEVPDQLALYSVLQRLADLAVPLVSVYRADEVSVPEGA